MVEIDAVQLGGFGQHGGARLQPDIGVLAPSSRAVVAESALQQLEAAGSIVRARDQKEHAAYLCFNILQLLAAFLSQSLCVSAGCA